MRTRPRIPRAIIVLACGVLASRAGAQDPFTGSDGSYRGALSADGSLHITATVTADMPPDGIFKCTTITVDAGAVLTFRRNALNTPVYLLATGPIVVNGTIRVSGDGFAPVGRHAGAPGGPGGFDGGGPGWGTVPAGAGQGPGGGKGASAANPTPGGGSYGGVAFSANPNNGAVYGTPLLMPLVGGSGGGGGAGDPSGTPGSGGGGGGGAILLASDISVTISGDINASGGSAFNFQATGGGGGSGGSIRIVSPIVSISSLTFGSNTLNVDPGSGAGPVGAHFSISGGLGRIRIDANTVTGLNFASNTPPSVGRYLKIFPDVRPTLHIVGLQFKDATGSDQTQTIPEDTPGPVDVTLPFNALPHLKVSIQPRGLMGKRTIHLLTTPENGASADHVVLIDASAPGPVVVEVDIPVNTRTHLLAFAM